MIAWVSSLKIYFQHSVWTSRNKMYTPELMLHVQPELEGEDDPEAQAELPTQHAPHIPAPAQQQIQVTTDILSPRVLLYPTKHICEIAHLIRDSKEISKLG